MTPKVAEPTSSRCPNCLPKLIIGNRIHASPRLAQRTIPCQVAFRVAFVESRREFELPPGLCRSGAREAPGIWFRQGYVVQADRVGVSPTTPSKNLTLHATTKIPDHDVHGHSDRRHPRVFLAASQYHPRATTLSSSPRLGTPSNHEHSRTTPAGTTQ